MAWIVKDKDRNCLLVFRSKPVYMVNDWKGSEPNDHPCAIILREYYYEEICDMFTSEHIESNKPFEVDYSEIIKFLGGIVRKRNQRIDDREEKFYAWMSRSYWPENKRHLY
jgi:hypothetical protein